MIRVHLDLNRPPEEAFDYFADFRNENEWNVVARDVRLLSGETVGRGSRFRGEYQRMGTLEYEIVEFDRPRHLLVKGSSKSFDFVSTFDFSPAPGGTRVEGTMEPLPKGMFRLFKPLMGIVVKGQMTKGMSSLKQTLEARPAAGPIT